MRAAILSLPALADSAIAPALTAKLLDSILEGSPAPSGFRPIPDGVARALDRALGPDAGENDDAPVVFAFAGRIRPTVEQGARVEELLAAAHRTTEEELESWMLRGYQAADGGEFEEASRCYLAADQALGHLGEQATPRRALVFVSLGDVARAQGRTDEAVAWLDRALSIAPSHIGALRARTALARELGEDAIAAALLHRQIPSLETESERAEALSAIASHSLAAAANAIERAATLVPADRSLRERLRAVYEARGQWDSVVGVAVQLAEQTSGREARAQALVEAARICSERTGNTARAVALYEAAIEDDPQVRGAFEAVEQELIRAGDFAGIAAAYRRQLERLRNRDAREDQCRILRRLAEVELTRLRDRAAARAALERLVELAPDDADSRVALAELLASMDELEAAVGELERAAELAPARMETYRRLYELLSAARDEDRTYAASAALVALGEADINEQMTYAQHSPSTVLATRRRFDADTWQRLLPAEHDAELDRVAAALEDAAVEVWLAEHREASGAKVPEKFRQQPAKTTVSAVRCAAWAAELLGVAVPAMYAQADNDRISVATLPLRDHALLLGRHVLAGRSVPELSFILARHLTYSRPGWRILTFYPQVDELEALFRAALAVACPDLPAVRELAPRAAELKKLLDGKLDPEARTLIDGAVRTLLARDARFDLLSWARGVETTACRAALVASGDVTVATTALAVSGVTAGGVSARDRMLALLPFAVSKNHTALRRVLGVAVS